MKTLLLLLLVKFSASFGQHADIKTLILHSDTLWLKNFTTGDSSQLNKATPSPIGQSNKVLSSNGANYVWATNSASVSWGGILGLLSDQSDLQTALNTKAGYSTGFGGTVTQLTNKSTAVTLNKMSGRITMANSALAAGAEVSFTVNNSLVTATDVPVVAIQSVGTAGSYLAAVGSVSNGAFTITLSNASTGSLSQAVILSYAIIKGSIN
jgi:hypothetical protein